MVQACTRRQRRKDHEGIRFSSSICYTRGSNAGPNLHQLDARHRVSQSHFETRGSVAGRVSVSSCSRRRLSRLALPARWVIKHEADIQSWQLGKLEKKRRCDLEIILYHPQAGPLTKFDVSWEAWDSCSFQEERWASHVSFHRQQELSFLPIARDILGKEIELHKLNVTVTFMKMKKTCRGGGVWGSCIPAAES